MKPEARTPQMGTCRCVYSTGIDGELTKGRGKLDDYGYWEFPCTHEVAAPVAPEKEARPTGQPERDYCAKCGVPRIIHEHPKANFGHGFLSDKMVAELAGGAVPQTPPDAELEKMFNALLLELDSSIVDDVRKRVQAYASAVTAQLRSELKKTRQYMDEARDEFCKANTEVVQLRAEVTRLKAAIDEMLKHDGHEGSQDWNALKYREARNELMRLWLAGEAKKGTPQT